jgi:hypothetical protein
MIGRRVCEFNDGIISLIAKELDGKFIALPRDRECDGDCQKAEQAQEYESLPELSHTGTVVESNHPRIDSQV